LVIVIAHVAFQITQKEKVNSFINPYLVALFGLVAIGIADIPQFSYQLAFKAGFFAHLAQRRLLVPLALFDVTFWEAPSVAHMNQRNIIIVAVSTVDHP